MKPVILYCMGNVIYLLNPLIIKIKRRKKLIIS